MSMGESIACCMFWCVGSSNKHFRAVPLRLNHSLTHLLQKVRKIDEIISNFRSAVETICMDKFKKTIANMATL